LGDILRDQRLHHGRRNLESLQLSLKQTAAKVQELFDCAVLDIDWHHFRVGTPPDPEIVAAAAAAYRRKHSDISNLRDWYSVAVGKLPPELGRIVCQRTNCQWDSHLRGRYTRWLLATLIGCALLIVAVGLYKGMPLERFVLAILAPLSPAFLCGIREWKKQRAAGESADRLKAHANEIWAAALASTISGGSLQTKARDLQDEIYERRRTNPLIFDWIYYRLRDEQEQQANQAADELVLEALGSSR
jgi:SMODS-associating 4TM effector domain